MRRWLARLRMITPPASQLHPYRCVARSKRWASPRARVIARRGKRAEPPRSRDTARAMSQENVEIVRRHLESFVDDVETWLDTFDPAVKVYPLEERHALVLGRQAALRARE